MEWADVVRAVTGAGPAHVATTCADGSPHVAVSFLAPVDGDLWLFTNRSAVQGANLLADPRLAVVWEAANAEVYVWGRVAVVEDPATIEHVWSSGALPFDPVGFFGSADEPDLLVARLVPERAMAAGLTAVGPGRQRWRAT